MRYAYDTIEKQMKRAKRPMLPLVPPSKGNKISSSSKHNNAISLRGNPSFVEDDDCFVVDKPKHLEVYLPEQRVVMKELLDFLSLKKRPLLHQRQKCKKKKASLRAKYYF